jgi:hypothetical protein
LPLEQFIASSLHLLSLSSLLYQQANRQYNSFYIVSPTNPSLTMAEASKASYSTDPALYIYTSLTAGSSHIVTATSRLETILRANRVPFKALDIATDDKARMLWGRRAGKDEGGRMRKLPGLVQMGLVLGVRTTCFAFILFFHLTAAPLIVHSRACPAERLTRATPPNRI